HAGLKIPAVVQVSVVCSVNVSRKYWFIRLEKIRIIDLDLPPPLGGFKLLAVGIKIAGVTPRQNQRPNRPFQTKIRAAFLKRADGIGVGIIYEQLDERMRQLSKVK